MRSCYKFFRIFFMKDKDYHLKFLSYQSRYNGVPYLISYLSLVSILIVVTQCTHKLINGLAYNLEMYVIYYHRPWKSIVLNLAGLSAHLFFCLFVYVLYNILEIGHFWYIWVVVYIYVAQKSELICSLCTY